MNNLLLIALTRSTAAGTDWRQEPPFPLDHPRHVKYQQFVDLPVETATKYLSSVILKELCHDILSHFLLSAKSPLN